MKGNFPIDKWNGVQTPFYFYDTTLLKRTLQTVKEETERYGFTQHYAIKANANPRLLQLIASYGFGADCVSGGEVCPFHLVMCACDNLAVHNYNRADWHFIFCRSETCFSQGFPHIFLVFFHIKGKYNHVSR